MVEALIVAVIYCVIVLLVAWLLVYLFGLLPVPARLSGILPSVIWIIAIIICLVILLRFVTTALPGLP